VNAASNAVNTASDAVNAAGDATLLARVVLSLIVVLLLAVLGARLARRLGLRTQGRNLRLLERLPLSRETFLAVVAVADRGLVLGVSAHGVRVLGELDGETLALAYPEPDPRSGEIAAVEVRPDGVTVTRLPDGAGPGDVQGIPNPGRRAPSLGRRAPRPGRRGSGSVLDPRTWRQAVEALRELTVRRG
jgi:flagellar protein FliO/FliZ